MIFVVNNKSSWGISCTSGENEYEEELNSHIYVINNR